MLVELQPDTIRQGELDLFSAGEEPEHAASRDRTKPMGAMDKLNGRYGKGSVQLGIEQRRACNAGLVDEGGTTDTAVHDGVGGDAGGSSIS